MDMQQIREEFERNGMTKDLDEMDYLMIKSRKRRDLPGQVVSDNMQKVIDKVSEAERGLFGLVPLSRT